MRFDKTGTRSFVAEQEQRRKAVADAVAEARAYTALLEAHQSAAERALDVLQQIRQQIESRQHEAESPLVRITWDEQFTVGRAATELSAVLDMLKGRP